MKALNSRELNKIMEQKYPRNKIIADVMIEGADDVARAFEIMANYKSQYPNPLLDEKLAEEIARFEYEWLDNMSLYAYDIDLAMSEKYSSQIKVNRLSGLHYGLDTQLTKLTEEMAELTQAILKDNWDNILEEIADVKNVLGSLDILLSQEDCSRIREIREQKQQRQFNRIANELKEKRILGDD